MLSNYIIVTNPRRLEFAIDLGRLDFWSWGYEPKYCRRFFNINLFFVIIMTQINNYPTLLQISTKFQSTLTQELIHHLSITPVRNSRCLFFEKCLGSDNNVMDICSFPCIQFPEFMTPYLIYVDCELLDSVIGNFRYHINLLKLRVQTWQVIGRDWAYGIYRGAKFDSKFNFG